MTIRTARLPSIGLLLFLPALLQSCATLSKQQCVNANWQAIGKHDGSRGLPRSRIARHADACQKASVVPDRQAWLEGHRIGARRFCTPANALALGFGGGKNHGICAADQRLTFERVYQLGLRRYALQKAINSLEDDIQLRRSEIENVRRQRDKGKIDSDRADAMVNVAHRDIVEAEVDLEQAERALTRFNQQLLRDGYMKMALAEE